MVGLEAERLVRHLLQKSRQEMMVIEKRVVVLEVVRNELHSLMNNIGVYKGKLRHQNPWIYVYHLAVWLGQVT